MCKCYCGKKLYFSQKIFIQGTVYLGQSLMGKNHLKQWKLELGEVESGMASDGGAVEVGKGKVFSGYK